MLILKVTYENFKHSGEELSQYTLSPNQGDVEFPEAQPSDLPQLCFLYLKQAFGEKIADWVYGESKTISVFTVKWKDDVQDPQTFTTKFVVTPNNYRNMFALDA